MTQEFESQLKRMFAELDADLPGGEFTSQVMSRALEPRRRERLLWSATILSALVFLWFAFPYVARMLQGVNALPRVLFAVAGDSWAAVSHSPLLYIYGVALGGYLLLRLLPRLRIPLM